jgi:hypothetical protein
VLEGLSISVQYRPMQMNCDDALVGGWPLWRYTTAITLFLFSISISIPVQCYASDDDKFSCAAYYGLNVCASTFELYDDELHFVEQDRNAFDTTKDKMNSSSETKPPEDGITEKQKEDVFKNTDSFRDYMKTLENPDPNAKNNEFSVKKKILDNTNYGLDCRLVTNSINELSNSNYYDCALQRYF